MEVHLTPQQEAHLSQLASHAGKTAQEFLHERVSSLLEEDEPFLAAVNEGLVAAKRGEFVDSAQLWAKIEDALRS